MIKENNHSEKVEKEATPFRMVATLAIAGMLSGVLLSLVYIYTKPIIEANKKEILSRAIEKVLPGTYHYDTLQISGGILSIPGGEAAKNILYLGRDSLGQITGFAIPGSEPGFQDIIKGLIGYNPFEKKIVGFEVLESKETPGLGDKIFKDENFTSSFKALPLTKELVIVKKGEKNQDHEVEGITGATISSKAVIRLINKNIFEWVQPMDEFIKKNDKQNATY